VNVFSAESFIDRLASEAKTDPFSFRRALLRADRRGRAVLELTTRKAGWGADLSARTWLTGQQFLEKYVSLIVFDRRMFTLEVSKPNQTYGGQLMKNWTLVSTSHAKPLSQY
jgi:hypothetical protein